MEKTSPTLAVEMYRARFQKVLDHIDAHLGEALSVERLSRTAALSKFHFHRQFSGLFGICVAKYVQLNRLKRASYQLAFRDGPTILDIALANGYEGPESFARAFKKHIGQSPSDFRRQPQWERWHAACRLISELRHTHMNSSLRIDQVKLIAFDETRVAVLEHRGDPAHIGDSIRRFIAWRKENHLPPPVSATFNIFHGDPAETDAEDFRLDLCAATPHEVAPNRFGVVAKTIPGGRCAVLRLVGPDDHLAAALMFMYADWLPQSGEELRDHPPYAQRLRFFPDVPDHEAVTDIFLPLK